MSRIALLLVSLAAVAWLASAYPGTRAEEQAKPIQPAAGGRLTQAQIARSIDLLEKARRARPDGEVVPKLAGLELTAGRPGPAVAQLRRLVRSEPENLPAWTALAFALQRSDPAAAKAALARRRALAPPVGP
jgi:predicted Zn-dependent protease